MFHNFIPKSEYLEAMYIETIQDAGIRTAATILHYAAEGGHTDICAMALAKGAPIQCCLGDDFDDYTTPFYKTVLHGHLGTCQYLFEHGASIELNANGEEGRPLTVAVQHGHYEIAKFLLEQGADPNGGDLTCFIGNDFYSGDTPLHYAARAGNVEMCSLLIQYGASINTDGFG